MTASLLMNPVRITADSPCDGRPTRSVRARSPQSRLRARSPQSRPQCSPHPAHRNLTHTRELSQQPPPSQCRVAPSSEHCCARIAIIWQLSPLTRLLSCSIRNFDLHKRPPPSVAAHQTRTCPPPQLQNPRHMRVIPFAASLALSYAHNSVVCCYAISTCAGAVTAFEPLRSTIRPIHWTLPSSSGSMSLLNLSSNSS